MQGNLSQESRLAQIFNEPEVKSGICNAKKKKYNNELKGILLKEK